MQDDKRTTNEQLKIELLGQWKLEAESRNIYWDSQTIIVLMSSEQSCKHTALSE